MSKQIKFDGAGFKAEKLMAKQFKAKLVSEKKYQYADIDAFVKNKKGKVNPVSIKDQLWSSGKFGGIQIETKLTNTRNGKTQEGCFHKSKAVDYFWRVWTEEHGDTWLIIRASRLNAYVEEYKDTLKTWCTKPNTEAKNRSFNRYYDRAEGFTIMVKDIMHIGQIKPVEGGKKH